jgi:hypothetical protein
MPLQRSDRAGAAVRLPRPPRGQRGRHRTPGRPSRRGLLDGGLNDPERIASADGRNLGGKPRELKNRTDVLVIESCGHHAGPASPRRECLTDKSSSAGQRDHVGPSFRGLLRSKLDSSVRLTILSIYKR